MIAKYLKKLFSPKNNPDSDQSLNSSLNQIPVVPTSAVAVVGISKRLFSILLVTLILVSALAIYFWFQANQAGNPAVNNIRPEDEVRALIEEIGQFLVLPENEEPTTATVTDLEALKNQPFFAKAQLGDKVLIYSKAKKAILYNPSTKKIVEVAPINLGNSSAVQP